MLKEDLNALLERARHLVKESQNLRERIQSGELVVVEEVVQLLKDFVRTYGDLRGMLPQYESLIGMRVRSTGEELNKLIREIVEKAFPVEKLFKNG